jgi:hypothetical protein
MRRNADISQWSKDLGSPNPFAAAGLGSFELEIATRSAEDSGSDPAEFQTDLRLRGLPFPLWLSMSDLRLLLALRVN